MLKILTIRELAKCVSNKDAYFNFTHGTVKIIQGFGRHDEMVRGKLA